MRPCSVDCGTLGTMPLVPPIVNILTGPQLSVSGISGPNQTAGCTHQRSVSLDGQHPVKRPQSGAALMWCTLACIKSPCTINADALVLGKIGHHSILYSNTQELPAW